MMIDCETWQNDLSEMYDSAIVYNSILTMDFSFITCKTKKIIKIGHHTYVIDS
jgi:hypothetical protein